MSRLVCQGLTNLSITNTGLSSAYLQDFSELTHLDLRNNSISSLNRPGTQTTLRNLYLSGNGWSCFTKERFDLKSMVFSRYGFLKRSHRFKQKFIMFCQYFLCILWKGSLTQWRCSGYWKTNSSKPGETSWIPSVLLNRGSHRSREDHHWGKVEDFNLNLSFPML